MVTPTFVTWKWPSPRGYRSVFGPETVNAWNAMVRRHYDGPLRVCCVTDDGRGIDRSVEIIPDWKDFVHLPSPSGGRNPACYRRLRLFHPEIGTVLGSRLVSMDLDVVITGPLRPLVDRCEDFVIYGDTNPGTFYNGSLILLTAGARPQVWTSFDPARSPQLARAAGHFGSDQAHISHTLGPGEAKFTPAEGVYSYRVHLKPLGYRLPANARIVIFHGSTDPWSPAAQAIPWIREHWRIDGVTVPRGDNFAGSPPR